MRPRDRDVIARENIGSSDDGCRIAEAFNSEMPACRLRTFVHDLSRQHARPRTESKSISNRVPGRRSQERVRSSKIRHPPLFSGFKSEAG
jgi:hypothetical protein